MKRKRLITIGGGCITLMIAFLILVFSQGISNKKISLAEQVREKKDSKEGDPFADALEGLSKGLEGAFSTEGAVKTFEFGEKLYEKYKPYLEKVKGTKYEKELYDLIDEYTINYAESLGAEENMKKCEKELKVLCAEIDKM